MRKCFLIQNAIQHNLISEDDCGHQLLLISISLGAQKKLFLLSNPRKYPKNFVFTFEYYINVVL